MICPKARLRDASDSSPRRLGGDRHAHALLPDPLPWKIANMRKQFAAATPALASAIRGVWANRERKKKGRDPEIACAIVVDALKPRRA